MKTFRNLKIGDVIYCTTFNGSSQIKTLLIKDIYITLTGHYCFSGSWVEVNNSHVSWIVPRCYIDSISTNDAATTPENAKIVFWKRISDANISARLMIRTFKNKKQHENLQSANGWR